MSRFNNNNNEITLHVEANWQGIVDIRLYLGELKNGKKMPGQNGLSIQPKKLGFEIHLPESLIFSFCSIYLIQIFSKFQLPERIFTGQGQAGQCLFRRLSIHVANTKTLCKNYLSRRCYALFSNWVCSLHCS